MTRVHFFDKNDPTYRKTIFDHNQYTLTCSKYNSTHKDGILKSFKIYVINILPIKMSHLTRREGVRIEAFQEEVLAGEVGDGDDLKVGIVNTCPTGNLVSVSIPGTGRPATLFSIPVETLLQLLK